MSDQPKKFYLTTPIYYVNARPHIGHAYTTIVADVLARRHRLLGDDTYFLTGTDEHGQKIERSAAAAGIPPQQFADQVSASFATLWQRMGITHDKFIRTTDPEHARGVQKLFSELYALGFIYLDSYTGAYCVSDEAFVDAPVGTPCPDCGRLLEEVTEENFFFKLSAFGDRIAALIESNELLITPDTRRNEVLSFVKGGLKDLSVSRSSFTWGIPVPEPAASAAKDKHVIYVWLDALANYMTAIGYGSDEPQDQANFAKFWPADLHLVGKEIIRFHCVYWPAFLLAAELPLPKAITAHGWLLFDNSKMSKSKGNIVRAETILDAFGTLCPPAPATNTVILSEAQRAQSKDPETAGITANAEPISPTKADRDLFAADILRYFLLREIPFGQDGTFSFDALITRYNADLANGYGNLVSRTLSMIERNMNGLIQNDDDRSLLARPISLVPETDVRKVAEALTETKDVADLVSNQSLYKSALDRNQFDQILLDVGAKIKIVDIYFSSHEPWKLAKSENDLDRRRLIQILYTAAESIRIITILLHPILPYATTRVWQQLGLDSADLTTYNPQRTTLQWGGLKPGTKLGPLGPIFPRADKGLAQIMTDMETPTPEAQPDVRPGAPLAQAATPTPAAPVTSDPTHPAAPPRTSSLIDPASGTHVAGSAAITTERETVSHADATPSAAFATVASQTPITAGPSDASPQITIDDFAKVELRVAQVVVAERIPKADKLLRLEVDLGAALPRRQILSGIAEHYTPEDLIGRRIIVITNLAPRKMRGLESHGMLLAASEESGKPFLATVPEGVPLGTRLK